MKYARLREEAKRLFGGIRPLAKAAKIDNSNISKLIKGDYAGNEGNLRRKIEAAVLEKEPEFIVDRLWDITSYYVEHVMELGKPVMKVDEIEYELIAVYKRRDK